MDRQKIKSVLAALRNRHCEDGIEKIQKMMLEKLVESEFSIDLIGTVTDEVGKPIVYIFSKEALLSEFFGGKMSCVMVYRTERIDAATRLYFAHQLKRIGKLSEDEKELALNRIVNALLIGENERVGNHTQQ